MKLSYSSISDYLNCPLKYKFRYVDRLPTKKTPALSFGSSLHEALAFLFNVKTPDPPSLDTVLNELKNKWLSDGYSSAAEEKQYFAHGRQVISKFYETNIADFKPPVALEHKFILPIGNFTLTGIIDRLDKVGEGHFEVIDYKTNRKLPPQTAIDKDLQLSIYHYATKQIWGFEPKAVSLYFLLPNHKMSSVRSDVQITETLDIIKKVASRIEEQRFEPTQNNLCPWCDFQPYCPYFSHKYQKSDEQITSLIEEYGRLKGQEKEIKSKASVIAAEISAWLKDKKERRLFSTNYEILKSGRKTISYDEEKVAQILEPLGLLSQVTSLDTKKLSALLENGILEDEIKNQLIKLATEKVSFALTCKSRKD